VSSGSSERPAKEISQSLEQIEVNHLTNPGTDEIVNRETRNMGNLPAFQKKFVGTSQTIHARDIRSHGTLVM
jgi:lipoate-protein ligase A